MIKLQTPKNEIAKSIMEEAKRVEMLTIRALSYLGEMCVKVAKDRPQTHSWFDQTGNLRSSIGYVIVHDGRIIRYSDFKKVKDGDYGVLEGRDLATELAKQFNTGYALIIVAGMNYAEYVEAKDNKDVLASSELFAREKLPEMLQKLKQQIAR